MRIELIFLLISALSSGVSARLFYFIPVKMNWTSAQTYCRQNYIDLASVDDRPALNDLVDALPEAFLRDVWIGLYRSGPSAPWIWSDQSKSAFRPWQSGQPNNYAGVQYCVLSSYQGLWNDWECTDDLPFICYSEMKRQMLRLEVKSSQNVNDPIIQEKVLLKVEQILKAKGLPNDSRLTWKTLTGGNEFHKLWYQRSDVSDETCGKKIN